MSVQWDRALDTRHSTLDYPTAHSTTRLPGAHSTLDTRLPHGARVRLDSTRQELPAGGPLDRAGASPGADPHGIPPGGIYPDRDVMLTTFSVRVFKAVTCTFRPATSRKVGIDV
jgi:hypothetical protein